MLLLLLLTEIGLATLSTTNGGLSALSSCDGSSVLALLFIVCAGDGGEWWNRVWCVMIWFGGKAAIECDGNVDGWCVMAGLGNDGIDGGGIVACEGCKWLFL